MGYEQEALNLFLTDNIVQAQEIAKRLNKYNYDRQQTEVKIFNEAIEMIENGEKIKLYNFRKRKLASWSNWNCIIKSN